ncbi:MAG: flagellar export chaperone FlgN [Thermodesulfobacteriota bacterium]
MLERIHANLDRQNKALALLLTLLEEEYSLLRERRAPEISRIEFSIQELLRQIAAERTGLRAMVTAAKPGARRLADLLSGLPAGESAALSAALRQADRAEQACAVQAEKNTIMAQALAEQSRSLLEYLHREIQPKQTDTYSGRGRYSTRRPEASLLQRRS